MNIPLSQPDISEAEIDAVAAVLRSSRLSLGPRLEEFESLLSAYVGVQHGIAVSSGTAALHLCLHALGLGEGDEVIVPSFTFIAAANAIRYVHATPVFVDIDPTTLNLDPQRVEDAITPRTRAILIVHTFGYPAEMAALCTIARRHGLLVLEDACEALGAEYNGQKIGSFGHAAVFAFYPNKQITTGEGGMIVTRDANLARDLRALRNQGRYESDDWLQHTRFGYNYRISEINCALGCAQMHRLNSILTQRERAARTYDEAFHHGTGITLPPLQARTRRISWFVYVIRLTETYTQADRDQVVRRMADAGIACGRYFGPIHMQLPYRADPPAHPLPVTEWISERTIALPFFNRITNEEIEHVCERLLYFLHTL